jgi:hypothetical protein
MKSEFSSVAIRPHHRALRSHFTASDSHLSTVCRSVCKLLCTVCSLLYVASSPVIAREHQSPELFVHEVLSGLCRDERKATAERYPCSRSSPACGQLQQVVNGVVGCYKVHLYRLW